MAEYTAWAQELVSVAISSVRQEKLRPIGVRSRSVSVGSEVPGKEGPWPRHKLAQVGSEVPAGEGRAM